MRRTALAAPVALIGAIWAGRTLSRKIPATETYELRTSQLVPAPLEETFRFFEDPMNLARLTPPQMQFQIVDVAGLPMSAGTKIQYRIRVLGVPQRWTTLIAEYEQGRRFVDIQTKGPYSYWRHEHRFQAVGDETLMDDHVEYRLPYGPLGSAVQRLLVARQLKQVFDFRAKAIVDIFGG